MLYQGPSVDADLIALMAPHREALLPLLAHAELTEGEKGWLDRARDDDGCLYFAVERDGRAIGQVLLHDIDPPRREAMVGYHIFQASDRGRGDGTAALGALCRYAFESLALRRLVMITGVENVASRRIAEKCGFREIGPAREGPELVAYELPGAGNQS